MSHYATVCGKCGLTFEGDQLEPLEHKLFEHMKDVHGVVVASMRKEDGTETRFDSSEELGE